MHTRDMPRPHGTARASWLHRVSTVLKHAAAAAAACLGHLGHSFGAAVQLLCMTNTCIRISAVLFSAAHIVL
jgi:hypothetical protein